MNTFSVDIAPLQKAFVRITYDKEVNSFVAYIPLFGVYSAGTTAAEAITAAQDALNSFLSVSIEKGLVQSSYSEQPTTTDP